MDVPLYKQEEPKNVSDFEPGDEYLESEQICITADDEENGGGVEKLDCRMYWSSNANNIILPVVYK